MPPEALSEEDRAVVATAYFALRALDRVESLRQPPVVRWARRYLHTVLFPAGVPPQPAPRSARSELRLVR